MPDSKDQIDAAFSEALDEVRATLHRLAEKLEQDHFTYDMKGPMDMAHDMLCDFDPYVRALDDLEESNRLAAREEERDLYRNTNQWGL